MSREGHFPRLETTRQREDHAQEEKSLKKASKSLNESVYWRSTIKMREKKRTANVDLSPSPLALFVSARSSDQKYKPVGLIHSDSVRLGGVFGWIDRSIDRSIFPGWVGRFGSGSFGRSGRVESIDRTGLRRPIRFTRHPTRGNEPRRTTPSILLLLLCSRERLRIDRCDPDRQQQEQLLLRFSSRRSFFSSAEGRRTEYGL